MPPWLAYTRVSRVGDRAERLISPDLQRSRIEAYASARGLEVEALDPELDVSGGKVERPILGAAIERVERGDAAGIIVAQLDRLSRMDIADALATIRRIEKAGGQVIAVAENFDASTPEGRLGRNVFLALGEMQLDRYRAQFRAAKRQAVERGIWPTRTAPIGYRIGAQRSLVVDSRAKQRVVRAFEARAAGKSWLVVGRILDRGQSGAAKVIRNRVYLGEVRLRDAIEGEWVNPVAHTPIVSRALWEAAQIAHPRPARGIHGRALLAGLVRCAGCRRTMTPDSASDQRSYRCKVYFARGNCPAPSWITQGRLDTYVERGVLAHLQGIRVERRVGAGAVGEGMERLTAAEAELEAYQQATSVTEVGVDAFRLGFRTRADRVEEARSVVGRARAAQRPSTSAELVQTWPSLSVGERGHVLRGALDVVWVFRGRGKVGDRALLIAAGFGPRDLPGPGRSGPLEGIEFDRDLPGVIAVADDVGEGSGGAGA